MALSLFSGSGSPQWGIFSQGGSPLLTASAVFGVEFGKEFRISNYPQEKGAFESYNKVELPFESKVVYLINKSTSAGFLQEVRDAVSKLDLVTVVTPEIQYPSANITGYRFRRTSRNGVELIQVEVGVEEVRIVATGQLSNTQSVNGAATQNNGGEQATDTRPTPVGGFQSGSAFTGGIGGTATASGLQSPQVGPAFYTGDNLPEVPNTYQALTGAQQQTVLSRGANLQSDNTTGYVVSVGEVTSDDGAGDAAVYYP